MSGLLSKSDIEVECERILKSLIEESACNCLHAAAKLLVDYAGVGTLTISHLNSNSWRYAAAQLNVAMEIVDKLAAGK